LSGQERQAITLEEALEQLQLLEGQLRQLQSVMGELETRIAQLTSVEDAIATLATGEHEALVPLDGRGSVLIKVTVKNVDRLLVHVGLNLFVDVPREKALEYIRDEKALLSKMLDRYRQEYGRLAQYYAALRSAVEQALQAAQQRGQQQ
jgi:prefoldin alpha subunit